MIKLFQHFSEVELVVVTPMASIKVVDAIKIKPIFYEKVDNNFIHGRQIFGKNIGKSSSPKLTPKCAGEFHECWSSNQSLRTLFGYGDNGSSSSPDK